MAHSMIPIIQISEYLERKRLNAQYSHRAPAIQQKKDDIDKLLELQNRYLFECMDFHGNDIHNLKCHVMRDEIEYYKRNKSTA